MSGGLREITDKQRKRTVALKTVPKEAEKPPGGGSTDLGAWRLGREHRTTETDCQDPHPFTARTWGMGG